MAKTYEKRLTKELQTMQKSPPPMIQLAQAPQALTEWFLRLSFDHHSVYPGQSYLLRFRFSERYPMDSPEVIFVDPIPEHEHIYTNGHICMDILYQAWSPALTVAAIAQSIHSMLAGAGRESKHKPVDDQPYVERCRRTGQGPKQTRWDFHDPSA
eukprot:Hpha_TRINITY_DN11361_c0_g1::TRINITY_DN11361_c0_g1_i1::g.63200::m.63200/K10688/UBE2W, UBC16; ubiquitin-conjugating enzyme E2 W